MKSAVLAFLALFGSAFADRKTWRDEIDAIEFARLDYSAGFKEFVKEHELYYKDAGEEYSRFQVWLENLRRIAQFNSEQHGSARLRMNKFGAMTGEEFKHAMFGETGSCYQRDEDRPRFVIGKGRAQSAPQASSVDWDAAGCVTPVKDQGQCGSCWAFSTTGSIECREAIKQSGGSTCDRNSIVSLSEQQLVDCSKVNAGCNGGNMASAMSYVQNNGGLCSESEYPYKARNEQCQSSTCGTKYDHITGHKEPTADSESSLEDAVNAGCVSVAIEADQFAFQYYSSGVLDGTCGTNLDHGVLVVGYGTYTNNEEYWKVKNSWGPSWGMNGYVLICRDCGKNGSKGECGILEDPVYPIA